MMGSRFKVSSIFEDTKPRYAAATPALAAALELEQVRVKNVELYGPGLVRGVTGARNHFEIVINTNIPDPVTISIDGPSRAEVYHNFGPNRMHVSYRVEQEGYYSLSVRYSGQHVSGSPFKVKVSKPGALLNSSISTVQVHGMGLETLRQGIPGGFKIYVASNSGGGYIQVTVVGPSKVFITCVEKNNNEIHVSYTPFSPGYYFVHVKFNDFHIAGSPFRAECHYSGNSTTDWESNYKSGNDFSLPELPLPEKNSQRRRWIFV